MRAKYIAKPISIKLEKKQENILKFKLRYEKKKCQIGPEMLYR